MDNYITLDLQFVIFAKSSDQFNNIEKMLLDKGLSGKYIKILAHEAHSTVANPLYGLFIMDQTKNNIKAGI